MSKVKRRSIEICGQEHDGGAARDGGIIEVSYSISDLLISKKRAESGGGQTGLLNGVLLKSSVPQHIIPRNDMPPTLA